MSCPRLRFGLVWRTVRELTRPMNNPGQPRVSLPKWQADRPAARLLRQRSSGRGMGNVNTARFARTLRISYGTWIPRFRQAQKEDSLWSLVIELRDIRSTNSANSATIMKAQLPSRLPSSPRWPSARAAAVAIVRTSIFILEHGDELLVVADVPGARSDTIDDNHLVLSGEKKESSETKEKGIYHSETRYGSFRRTLPLPEGVDAEHVDVHYNNGVLTLHLPKTAPAAQKRIEVKVKQG